VPAGGQPRALPAERGPEPDQQAYVPDPEQSPWFQAPKQVDYHGGYDPTYEPEPSYGPEPPYEEWYEEQQPEQPERSGPPPRPAHPEQEHREQDHREQEHPEPPGHPASQPSAEDTGAFPVPAGPNRTRELGEGGGTAPQSPDEEGLYQVFRYSIEGEGMPTPGTFAANVEAAYGLRLRSRELGQYMDRFTARLNDELMEEHIA
ncbi:hypothetical protein ACFC02_41755, partial [Streptomyces sp. NPDC056160]